VKPETKEGEEELTANLLGRAIIDLEDPTRDARRAA
jgi:hypothetical protein